MLACTIPPSTNETNSNFGFNRPWWDRLFGACRAQPGAGHEAMTIGVDAFRTGEDLRLDRSEFSPYVPARATVRSDRCALRSEAARRSAEPSRPSA
jgi:hypothetical protein